MVVVISLYMFPQLSVAVCDGLADAMACNPERSFYIY